MCSTTTGEHQDGRIILFSPHPSLFSLPFNLNSIIVLLCAVANISYSTKSRFAYWLLPFCLLASLTYTSYPADHETVLDHLHGFMGSTLLADPPLSSKAKQRGSVIMQMLLGQIFVLHFPFSTSYQHSARFAHRPLAPHRLPLICIHCTHFDLILWSVNFTTLGKRMVQPVLAIRLCPSCLVRPFGIFDRPISVSDMCVERKAD